MAISLETHIKHHLTYIFVVIVCFFLVYGQTFSFLPLGIAKIILIFSFPTIAFWIIKAGSAHNWEVPRALVYLFFGWLATIIFSSITIIANGTWEYSFLYVMLLELTEFLLCGYLFTALITKVLKKNEIGLVNMLAIITALQGAFIIWSFYSAPFREMIGSLLPISGNIEETDSIRMRGFANSSGATASLVQAIGFFCSVIMLSTSHLRWAKLLYLVTILLQIFSILFTGRSGIIAVAFFTLSLPYVFYSKHLIGNILKFTGYLLGILLVLVGLYFLFYNQLDSNIRYLVEEQLLDYAFEPFIKASRGELSESNSDLAAMLILPDNIKSWLIGDGWYTVDDGANYMGTDSGYIKSLFFFGIIGAALFYIYKLFIFGTILLGPIQRPVKRMMGVIILYLIIFQIKEPFITKPEISKITFSFFFMAICNTKSNRLEW